MSDSPDIGLDVLDDRLWPPMALDTTVSAA
jgi:hypothetical protein